MLRIDCLGFHGHRRSKRKKPVALWRTSNLSEISAQRKGSPYLLQAKGPGTAPGLKKKTFYVPGGQASKLVLILIWRWAKNPKRYTIPGREASSRLCSARREYVGTRLFLEMYIPFVAYAGAFVHSAVCGFNLRCVWHQWMGPVPFRPLVPLFFNRNGFFDTRFLKSAFTAFLLGAHHLRLGQWVWTVLKGVGASFAAFEGVRRASLWIKSFTALAIDAIGMCTR